MRTFFVVVVVVGWGIRIVIIRVYELAVWFHGSTWPGFPHSSDFYENNKFLGKQKSLLVFLFGFFLFPWVWFVALTPALFSGVFCRCCCYRLSWFVEGRRRRSCLNVEINFVTGLCLNVSFFHFFVVLYCVPVRDRWLDGWRVGWMNGLVGCCEGLPWPGHLCSSAWFHISVFLQFVLPPPLLSSSIAIVIISTRPFVAIIIFAKLWLLAKLYLWPGGVNHDRRQ